ncbi:MAG: hypothetical protein F4Y51_03150 [Cenarchaeum sp. SB0664_bin_35]|nr:hypothetical protein [Cenarchaeum sp. SB0664_bin_35]
MSIPANIRNFITTQLDYYIEEIDTYLLVAKEHCGTESLDDAAYGVVLGCVYMGFINAYSAQSLSPNVDSITELHGIIKERAKDIRLSIRGSRQRCQA